MDKDSEKLITKIVDTRLEAISKKIDTLQTTVDRAIEQLNDDRKDISDIKVSLGKNLAVAEGTRDDIEAQTQRVVNKVQENLQPMPDVISDAMVDAIKGKKVIKMTGKSIFRKLLFWK